MNVIVETFLKPDDPSDAQYRLRLVDGEPFPNSMLVQCSGTIAQEAPLGSKFRISVELVEDEKGIQFLRQIGKEKWVRVLAAEVLCKFKFEHGM
jgi:hypothetical protein